MAWPCLLTPVGTVLDPAAMIRFLAPRMANFMVPRYVDVLDALPKTESNKVQKHVLRERGVTTITWDREAAGITLKR